MQGVGAGPRGGDSVGGVMGSGPDGLAASQGRPHYPEWRDEAAFPWRGVRTWRLSHGHTRRWPRQQTYAVIVVAGAGGRKGGAALRGSFTCFFLPCSPVRLVGWAVTRLLCPWSGGA